MTAETSSAAAEQKTFAEFFAGIGLVREGLSGSGWRCVYANDLDPKKQEIYVANFPGAEEFDLRDVWDTDEVLERLGKSPFLATASFPCVDLSLAGNLRGFEGADSSTFFAFAEVLQRLSPRPWLVLVENVMGFISSRGGRDFRAAALRLADLGYYLDAFVLNAAAFTPQSRRRVFVAGVHEAIDVPDIIARGDPLTGRNVWLRAARKDAGLRPASLVAAVEETEASIGWIVTSIETPPTIAPDLATVMDLDAGQAWWNEGEVARHYGMLNDRHRERIDQLIGRGEKFVGTAFRRRREGTLRMEVRFDRVAGCLRTPRGGSARQIVVAVEGSRLRMRWMSAIEYARLQGADRFKLLSNERQMLFGFGDAVCVPVISWIDRCVLTPIFNATMAGGSL